MIISLSGSGGSGKSTIAERLAKDLNWPRYYMGGIRREMAKKRGITLAEYNKFGENDISTDKEVDDYQQELGKNEDNFVIEGRTSWLFIPHSLKIYLFVSLEEGAKRVFKQLQEGSNRNEDKALNTYEDVLASMEKRAKSDKLRYEKYYNVDVNDKKHYDLYLDTSNLDRNEAYLKVFEFVKSRLDKQKK